MPYYGTVAVAHFLRKEGLKMDLEQEIAQPQIGNFPAVDMKGLHTYLDEALQHLHSKSVARKTRDVCMEVPLEDIETIASVSEQAGFTRLAENIRSREFYEIDEVRGIAYIRYGNVAFMKRSLMGQGKAIPKKGNNQKGRTYRNGIPAV